MIFLLTRCRIPPTASAQVSNSRTPVILGASLGPALFLVFVLLIFLCRKRRNRHMGDERGSFFFTAPYPLTAEQHSSSNPTKLSTGSVNSAASYEIKDNFLQDQSRKAGGKPRTR